MKSFRVCAIYLIFLEGTYKEGRIVCRAWNVHVGEKFQNKFYLEFLTIKDHVGDMGVGESVLLKSSIEICDVRLGLDITGPGGYP
jgi:hypothetical protein